VSRPGRYPVLLPGQAPLIMWPLSYDAVFAMAPPIRASQFGSLRLTGSREARLDIVFDHRGGSLPWNGQPIPENVIHEKLNYNESFEGLVGGELPIIHWVLSLDDSVSPPGWWEMTAVPKPENDGSHEQAVFFRFQRIIQASRTQSHGLSLGPAVYFETYQYVAGAFTAEPEHFFDNMLAQRRFWSQTWQAEQIMTAKLPSAPGTDGAVLLDQAKHGLHAGRGQLQKSAGLQPGC
jgi:hypothetical protein